MERKERSKLNKLVRKYEKELSKGDSHHLKDFIAAKTILNVEPYDFDSFVLKDITLDYLMYLRNVREWGVDTYEVPSFELLNYFSKKCEKEIKDGKRVGRLSFGALEEYAAINWLMMMLDYSMITENQVIKPKEFALADFITDNELKAIYFSDNYFLEKHIKSSKTKKRTSIF